MSIKSTNTYFESTYKRNEVEQNSPTTQLVPREANPFVNGKVKHQKPLHAMQRVASDNCTNCGNHLHETLQNNLVLVLRANEKIHVQKAGETCTDRTEQTITSGACSIGYLLYQL